MVFRCIWILYGVARQFAAVFVRIISLLWSEFNSCRSRLFQKKKEQDLASVFTVCSSGWSRDDAKFRASFTIEATVVLGVLFMAIASLIRYIYTEHDKVIGTMILEEMLVRARRDYEGVYQENYFESIGGQLGSSQLWFDDYELDISRKKNLLEGKASAGEWEQEMEMGVFNPSAFLRLKEDFQGLTEDGEENNDREYPVQAGDE